MPLLPKPDRPNRITVPRKATDLRPASSVRERRNRLRARLKGEDFVDPGVVPPEEPWTDDAELNADRAYFLETQRQREINEEEPVPEDSTLLETEVIPDQPVFDFSGPEIETEFSLATGAAVQEPAEREDLGPIETEFGAINEPPPEPAHDEYNAEADYFQDREAQQDPDMVEFFEDRAAYLAKQQRQKESQLASAPVAPGEEVPSYAPPPEPELEDPVTKAKRVITVGDHFLEILPGLYGAVTKTLQEVDRFNSFLIESAIGITAPALVPSVSVPVWKKGDDGRFTISIVSHADAEKLTKEGKGSRIISTPSGPKLETGTGKVIESIGHFLLSFVGVGKFAKPAQFGVKAFQGVGTGRAIGRAAVEGGISGSIADFALFDPHEARLADVVAQYPGWHKPIADALAADPNDSQAFGRLKNAVEGTLIGAPLDMFMAGIRALNAARRAKAALPNEIEVPTRAPDPDPDLSVRERREELTARLRGDAPATPGRATDETVEAVRAADAIDAADEVRSRDAVDFEPPAAAARATDETAASVRAAEAVDGAAEARPRRPVDIEAPAVPGRAADETVESVRAADAIDDVGEVRPRTPADVDAPAAAGRAADETVESVRAADAADEVGEVRARTPEDIGRAATPDRPAAEATADAVDAVDAEPAIRAIDPRVPEEVSDILSKVDGAISDSDKRTILDLVEDAPAVKAALDQATGPVSAAVKRSILELVQSLPKVVDEVTGAFGREAPGPQAYASGDAGIRAGDTVGAESINTDPYVDRAAQFTQETGEDLFSFSRPKAGEEAALNINYDRLATTDDVKSVLDALARVSTDTINEARREVQTNELTRELAARGGLTVEKLLQRRKGQAFNAEEALAARDLLVAAGNRVTKLAREVNLGTTDAEVLNDFRASVATLDAIHAQVAGLTAEAGRALQAFRIPAGQRSFRGLRATENIRAAGGIDEIRKLAAQVSELGADKVAKLSGERNVGEAAFEVWYNGLLSSTATHAANILGNTLTIGLANTTRLVAAGIHAPVQAGRGLAKRVTPNRWWNEDALEEASKVETGEAWQALTAQFSAIREATRLAGQAFYDDFAEDLALDYARRSLPDELRSLTKSDHEYLPAFTSRTFNLEDAGMLGRFADVLGSAIRLPGRALNASDVFFKVVGYRGELHALAYRQAVQQGLKGDALTDAVKQIVDSPSDALRARATSAAEYQTFTRPLEKTGRDIQNLARHPLGKIVLPFVKTPINILKHVSSHSPAALVAPSFYREIMAGGARADVAAAKFAVGSGVIGLTALAAYKGFVTGGGPANSEAKARLRETGWQPYSIKIGDTYLSYARLDPIATLLAVGADYVEIVSQMDDETSKFDLAAAAVMGIADNVLSKTWFKSVADMVDALDDLSNEPERPGYALQRYVSKLTASGIPFSALVAQTARATDPVLRSTGRGWGQVVEQAKSRIPGLSATLPPRRNMFGEPVILGAGVGVDAMSPIYISRAKNDPVSDEIAAQGTRIRMPSWVMDGVQLTSEEYDEFTQLAAGIDLPGTKQTLKQALADQIKSRLYKTSTDGKDGYKSQLIKGEIRYYRKLAKAVFLSRNDRVAAQVEARKRKKLEALSGI